MSEEWKEIECYPNYFVSNRGIVKNSSRREIKLLLNNSGYLKLSLYNSKGQKIVFIHRIVAQAFIPNTDNKKCVNHKDGNKLNNCVENLEWVTYSENMSHCHKNKLQKTKEGKEYKKFGGEIQALENGIVIDILTSRKDVKLKGYQYGNILKCLKGERLSHKGK